jgi:hypothetical protein
MTFPATRVKMPANEEMGPKARIKALWDGFSELDWTFQKLIPTIILLVEVNGTDRAQ